MVDVFRCVGTGCRSSTINSDYVGWFASQYYVVDVIQGQNMIACNLAGTLVYEHAHAVWQKRNHAQFTAAFLKAVRVLGVIEAWRTWDHKEPCHSANDWQY